MRDAVERGLGKIEQVIARFARHL